MSDLFDDDPRTEHGRAEQRSRSRALVITAVVLLVGFVGFSSQTNAVVEPTLQRDEVRSALDALQADGGTATGDALDTALDRLEARRGKDGKRAPAAVILLSDGKRTEGSDPLAAAERDTPSER